MDDREIILLAKELAGKLNLIVKNELHVIRSMRSKAVPTTTILWNKNYMMWIDKFYVAYCDRSKVDIWYAFIVERHIQEELTSLNRRIEASDQLADYVMLSNSREQMVEA